jgi:4a-hydroxytetrahydrobiopterin dehydratase
VRDAAAGKGYNPAVSASTGPLIFLGLFEGSVGQPRVERVGQVAQQMPAQRLATPRCKVTAAGIGPWLGPVGKTRAGWQCPGEVRVMSTLSAERCVACRRDSPRVTETEIAALTREISGWQLLERDGIAQLERVFHFPSFADALAFTNRIGALAEAEGHHPALLTEWGRMTVTWWTHKIRGLHRNDFIMAAKTDALATGIAPITPEEARARGAP